MNPNVNMFEPYPDENSLNNRRNYTTPLLFDHDCGWIILLIAAYLFLSNGCLQNIFGECDNSIIWIIALFVLLYMYNQKDC